MGRTRSARGRWWLRASDTPSSASLTGWGGPQPVSEPSVCVMQNDAQSSIMARRFSNMLPRRYAASTFDPTECASASSAAMGSCIVFFGNPVSKGAAEAVHGHASLAHVPRQEIAQGIGAQTGKDAPG